MKSLGNFPDPFPTAPRVALTFDAEHPDRPWRSSENAERILDHLAERGVAATFFVQGRWAESQPETARRIAVDGHLVGNHSKYHARMTLFTDEGLRTDVREAAEAIYDIIGTDPKPWFRCPFGDGHGDERVQGPLAELGYRDVHWDVALEDWEPWRDAAAISRDAIEGVRAHGDGAVVLLHTWPDGTHGAVPPIVDGLRADGFRFVRLDELPEEALP
ncbi:MAG TPA: polysaccharide deacetylase family protein [Actinomycetota bacterium]